MKLFLDANILFTAAYSPGGISRALFDLDKTGSCELVSSAYAMEVARRNLAVKAPACLADFTENRSLLRIVAEPSPQQTPWATELSLPAKDVPIVTAACEAGCDILVTGDRRDFGHLFGVTIRGLVVLPPADTLLRILPQAD